MPPSKLGAQCVIYTAWTTGQKLINLQALFLSPKNNIEGSLAVLEAANCNIWVHPSEQRHRLPVIQQTLEQRPMQVLQLPKLAELLDAEGTKPFPYAKEFKDAAQDPFCMLHTSGTTGVPKPISWSHGLIGTMDAVRLLPPTGGDGGLPPWTALWDEGDTIYSSFPMSHVSDVPPIDS
jgi:acyl-CoA synthetase (AMP-forming)/AMP-acid ligase II